jgi:type III restriction enzyme
LQIPQLCLLIDGELEPAQEEHFLSPDSWSLLDYPAELTESEFRVEKRTDTYEIDVQGKRLVERHLNTQSILAFDEVPTNWTDLQLSREIVESLRRDMLHAHNYKQFPLMEFVRLTLRYLEDRRGISLNTLYQVRVPLVRALREKIEQYRQKAFSVGYQMRLFSPESAIETSSQHAFAFDPENYPATLHYNGGFRFPKHYYSGMVGDFDSKEELECAKAIEMNPHVKRWIRNVRNMFGLPTSSGTFYPDFIAELDDGRILVTEYKGEHLIQYEQEKKNVGELWENKSGGKTLFLWAIKKDAAGRDVHRQLEDKIRGRA